MEIGETQDAGEIVDFKDLQVPFGSFDIDSQPVVAQSLTIGTHNPTSDGILAFSNTPLKSYSDRHPMPTPLAATKLEYRRVCMLHAMKNKLPKKWPQIWGWKAHYETCLSPMARKFGEDA